VNRPVQSLDIYPTLIEIAGLPTPPQGLEGKSLVPLMNHVNARWDHPAFSIWSEDGLTVHGTAVRTAQWRYAEFGDNAVNGEMLFDVHADPQELHNLADDPRHAQVRADLSKLIQQYGQQQIA